MPPPSYRHLQDLLGGWFHQDFDIAGDTLAEIVDQYKAVTSQDEIAAVIGDIAAFLEQSRDNVDAAFVEAFRPDIDPAGWGMTAAQWLLHLRDILERQSA